MVGSTIATAFSVGEAKDKHVGILEIKGRKFRFKPKMLVTVRPMILKDIFLKDVLPKMKVPRDKDPLEVIEKHVKHQVEMLLKNPLPTLPLLRVRVVHEHQNEAFNPVRYATGFNLIRVDYLPSINSLAGLRSDLLGRLLTTILLSLNGSVDQGTVMNL